MACFMLVLINWCEILEILIMQKIKKSIVLFALMSIFSDIPAATILYDEAVHGDLGFPLSTIGDLVSGDNIIKGSLFPNETTGSGVDGDFFRLNLLSGFNITSTKLTISELILVGGAISSNSFYFDNGAALNNVIFPANGDYFPSFQNSIPGVYSISRDVVTTQSFNWEWTVSVNGPKSVPEPNSLVLIGIALFCFFLVNYHHKQKNKDSFRSSFRTTPTFYAQYKG